MTDISKRIDAITISIGESNERLMEIYQSVQDLTFLIKAVHRVKPKEDFSRLLESMEEVDKALKYVVNWTENHVHYAKPFTVIFNIDVNKLSHKDFNLCNCFFSNVNKHLNKHISIRDICASANKSYSSICRLLNRICGMPPHKVVLVYKMYYARYLIEIQGKGIKETMLECGFSDSSHFSRLYSKYNHILPSDSQGIKR